MVHLVRESPSGDCKSKSSIRGKRRESDYTAKLFVFKFKNYGLRAGADERISASSLR
jgi:hypothetical protein